MRRPRSFWSGTITFGLVSVPVDLYPAQRSARVSLRMLAPDGTPLRRRYYDPETEKEVDDDEIVRAYELESGDFVVVTDEELEGLEPEKTRDIDLRVFVPIDQLDPIFFDRAYFLTPAGNSSKAYRLLASAMEARESAGIATFIMRGKEYLVAILAENGILRAETLRFADEVRSAESIGLPARKKPKAATVKALKKAIAKLEEETLDPDELEDDYAERVRALAEAKRKKGEDVVKVETEDGDDGETDIIDLMTVLKRSMKGVEQRKPAKRASKGNGTSLEGLTKDELYARAQALDIEGRSGMTKAQLAKAIAKAS